MYDYDNLICNKCHHKELGKIIKNGGYLEPRKPLIKQNHYYPYFNVQCKQCGKYTCSFESVNDIIPKCDFCLKEKCGVCKDTNCELFDYSSSFNCCKLYCDKCIKKYGVLKCIYIHNNS